MRHYIVRAITVCVAIVATLSFFSCTSSQEDKFNTDYLFGKWHSGTEYYFFSSTGTGYTWDSSEVEESEAQNFTWSMSGSTLTIKHSMNISSAQITKTYTVMELTSATLKFKDSYGSFSFIKVP